MQKTPMITPMITTDKDEKTSMITPMIGWMN